jgi:hypothetical protein
LTVSLAGLYQQPGTASNALPLAQLRAELAGEAASTTADSGGGNRTERFLEALNEPIGVWNLAKQVWLDSFYQLGAQEQRFQALLIDERRIRPPASHQTQRGVDLRYVAEPLQRLRQLRGPSGRHRGGLWPKPLAQ